MDHKILLIDDSAILRRIAANVLSTQAGCGEVVTAARATEGFARACTSGARLILVDYQIAGFPNADFCRRLLAEPRTCQVPVILLLSPGMILPPRESLPANVVDHLVKPFTPEQLLGAVRSVIRGPALELPVRRLREVHAASDTRPTRLLSEHRATAVSADAAVVIPHETDRSAKVRLATLHAGAARVAASDKASDGRRVDATQIRSALLTAADRRETGVLRVRAGSDTTEVYLDGGQIVVIATHDARRYSADASGVVPPKVSPAMLEDALEEQVLNGVPFFLTLGSSGLLSKSVAVSLLHRFGQRHFARLWSMPSGLLSFEYEALDALPGFALRLEPRSEGIDTWLLEASRNLQSKDIAGVARHEGFSGVPRLQPGTGSAHAATLPLNDQERGLVRLTDGRRTLAAIAAELEVTTEHAFLLLYRFRCLGIMEYRPAGSAFVVTPRTSVRRVLPLHR